MLLGRPVTVETDRGHQTRALKAGSGFLSQHSKEVFFGLGDTHGPVNASIRWPSGLVQQFRGLPINHRIWVEERAGESTAPVRMEPFQLGTPGPGSSASQQTLPLPATVETWLLAPIPAPDFARLSALRGKPVLLQFQTAGSQPLETSWSPQGLQLLHVNFDLSDEVSGTYNVLYRYLFDRHRDLQTPTSFLIDTHGDIAKVYQGPVNPENVEHDVRHIPQTVAERLAKALPFPGVSSTYDFGRNYLSLGAVFFRRGYLDQAEASYRLALRDDPSAAEPYYGLGSVYLRQQKTSAARDSFEHAVKLPASYPDTLPNAWNNLGLLDTREGRTEQAIGCFQQALRLSPDYWIALENLGNAYRQQQRWVQAQATLARALAIRPQDPEANYSLGMVFAQTGETGRAYDYLQKALHYRPSYPEALNNLGVLYLRTKRRDEAVAKFEECIRAVPSFDQSYLNLARVYSLEGESHKARTLLLELLRQHPGHAEAQRELDQLR